MGRLDDVQLLHHLSRCRAVAFLPLDEDYGFVTVEAFQAGKPLVTTADAGGVLELVDDGINGFVCTPEPRAIAARLDQLWADREAARQMGAAGRERVREIAWDRVIQELMSSV